MARKSENTENTVINILKNEKVVVRYIPRKKGYYEDPKSPLKGGLAETSQITLVVPRLRSGVLKNILTDVEKDFIEEALGIGKDALSIYKRENNYWMSSTPNCINSVVLTKRDTILNLNDLNDYIKYKILLANDDIVCPSLSELEERPKATYRFVLVNEVQEAKSVGNKANAKYESYVAYGKYKDNPSVLRCIIELIEGKRVAHDTKLEHLQSMVTNLLETDMRRFNSVVTDELLTYKALIKEGIYHGIILFRNGLHYFKEDSTPLSEEYEEPRLNTAAKFLAAPANQDLKDKIEYLIKNS